MKRNWQGKIDEGFFNNQRGRRRNDEKPILIYCVEVTRLARWKEVISKFLKRKNPLDHQWTPNTFVLVIEQSPIDLFLNRSPRKCVLRRKNSKNSLKRYKQALPESFQWIQYNANGSRNIEKTNNKFIAYFETRRKRVICA